MLDRYAELEQRIAAWAQVQDDIRAVVVIGRTLHDQVLTMMTWHARSMRGDDYETWYGGRDVERWADARAVAALPGLFPGYERDALRGALMRWLVWETAVRLGCAFPATAYDRGVGWIEALSGA